MPPAADPCVIMIFGASGDLTWRKLVPALFEAHRRGQLPDATCILGVSRSHMTDDQYREHLYERFLSFPEHPTRREWESFATRVFYHAADLSHFREYEGLLARAHDLAEARNLLRLGGQPNILFYLSVAPELYIPIVDCIGQSGVVSEGKRWCAIDPASVPWQRIIVEKPFGHDLDSAVELNKALGRVFDEEAIYRIDHYLGKELVQNMLVMRFGNAIFEPLWSGRYVDHVQMTAAESIGVEDRVAFYDQTGAMRDMIQSHLLQVLALVAMEPPPVYEAGAVIREKIKLLSCAHPISAERAHELAVFGRYAGVPGIPAYASLKGVDSARRTETFAALRVEFDNWRWAGVPFYLRSGKRMARKLTEVVIQFKRPPTDIFRRLRAGPLPAPNRLVIRMAPREGIILVVQGKVPGSSLRIDCAELDLDYQERFGGEPMEAYGPLLLDAMRGDRTLYKHRDEVVATWEICQPLLDSTVLRERIEEYLPGSWGPHAADELLAREGKTWHNPHAADVASPGCC